jgi:hypothetical protein
MEAKDLEQFAKIMHTLSRVFEQPGKPLSNETLDLYFQVFKNISIKDFTSAANGVIRNRVYSGMPKPAELLNELVSLDDLALQAWIAIEDAGYAAINLKDEVAKKIWHNLNRRYREAKPNEMSFIQAEFERRYKSEVRTKQRPKGLISGEVIRLLPTLLKSIK